MRDVVSHIAEIHGHLATEQVNHRRCAALVVDMLHGKSAAPYEHDHYQVRQTAGAARCIGYFDRTCANIRNQVAQRLHCWEHGCADPKHQRVTADDADRCEVLHRVIAHRLDVRQHRQLRHRGDKQGVAIGTGPGHCLGRNRTPCAGAILHHELLPGHLCQAFGCNTRDGIGIATSGKGNNHPHRALRPGLCSSRTRDSIDQHQRGRAAKGSEPDRLRNALN